MSSLPRTVFTVGDPEVNPYKLLIALVVPRPIAWVSSLSSDGVANLAPHSFFNVASASPPIVCFTSVGGKDTLANVEATGEFVVNLASEPQLEQVNNSSARFDPHTSEAAALGIVMEPSERVRPHRVAGSPASIECTLHSTVELGDSTLVLGDVVTITVHSHALVAGHPAMEHLQPISRLGRNEFGLPPEVVAIDRPRRPADIPGWIG